MAVRNYSSLAGEMSLAVSVSDSATTFVLNTVAGLPAAPFSLVVDAGAAGEEVVEVSALAGASATVVRGIDGTVPVQHSAGARVLHMATARDFQEPNDHSNASTDVHGVGAGAVVGTSTTQVLTNKTISGSTNTLLDIDGDSIVDGSIPAGKLGGDIDAATVNGLRLYAMVDDPAGSVALEVGDIWVPVAV